MVKGNDGDLYGSLSDNGGVGTSIELGGYTAEETLSYTRSWFDESVPNPAAWLWPFAQTRGEGSMAALWRDGDGRVRIVHLGSGSGSIMPAPAEMGDEDATDPFCRWIDHKET